MQEQQNMEELSEEAIQRGAMRTTAFLSYLSLLLEVQNPTDTVELCP